MTKAQREKHKEEIVKAEDFARKALKAVSGKSVSETKVRAVAKKVSLTMARVLAHA
jgi:hypothetical protein